MKIIFSHPTGNANVRAIVKGFLGADVLGFFYTSLACYPGNIWDIISKLQPFSELRRRQFDTGLQPYTKIHPFKEIGRMVANKLKLKNFLKHETGYFSIDQIYRYNDQKVVNALVKYPKIDAVYAYEDGALETFRQAKKLGIQCIYDLPIAYWETGRQLMLEEAQRLPNWANTLAGGIKDSQAKLDRKTEELALADTIVVASQFVKDSLPKFTEGKQIIMSPFGSPFSNTIIKDKNDFNKPLRVLFVGSMGQRKGLGDLFAAFKLLNNHNIQLVVMGSLIEPLEFYKNEFSDFIYEQGRSNDEVLKLMQTCDVFCLPSIVEGRALVMQEAMSQGLPLIITANTGGEDLIIEGKTGFLVPIRSPESIAEKLIWFLSNRSQIPQMGLNAQQHAMTYTWENYSKTIVTAINRI